MRGKSPIRGEGDGAWGVIAPRSASAKAVHRLAAKQHGLVTRGQLLDLGMDRRAIDRRVKSQRLKPVHTGVYLLGPVMPALAREMAAVLACGADAVLSHRSAARSEER